MKKIFPYFLIFIFTFILMWINTHREVRPIFSVKESRYHPDSVYHESVGEKFYSYLLIVNNTENDVEILDIKLKEFSNIQITRVGAIEADTFPPDINLNVTPEEQNFKIRPITGIINPNQNIVKGEITVSTGRVIFIEGVATGQKVVNPRTLLLTYRSGSSTKKVEIGSNISEY